MKKVNITVSDFELRLENNNRFKHVREVYLDDFLLNFQSLGVYSRNHRIESNFNSMLHRDRSWAVR